MMCTYGVGLGCVQVFMYTDWLWWRTRLGTDFKLICSHVWFIFTAKQWKVWNMPVQDRTHEILPKAFLHGPNKAWRHYANTRECATHQRWAPLSATLPLIPQIPWWENCRAKSNERSTWTFRSFTQRARDQDNVKQQLMEFQGPFWNDGSMYTFFAHHI